MREEHLSCLNSTGFHHLHYTDWGDPANPRAVICVHGLTRNCRDFDALAAALQNDLRVISVSIAGRGKSDWLPNKDDYGYPQYMNDMTALMARVTAAGAQEINWIGTSMGGMLGMLLASRPNSPLQRLVLNDVGTLIPKASMERIGAYVGKNPLFNTFAELEQYVRKVSAPFGPLSDAQWHHLAEHNARCDKDGRWGMAYDPGIATPFHKAAARDIVLWSYYDAIRCPTLLMRGAESDLLLHETAIEMTRRGPQPKLVEFAGVGHAPALMADDQIAAIREFLLPG